MLSHKRDEAAARDNGTEPVTGINYATTELRTRTAVYHKGNKWNSNVAALSIVLICCLTGVQASAQPYRRPSNPHDELPLCMHSWSLKKCQIVTYSAFGVFISIMLVPTFIMFYKSHRATARLAATLAATQEKRREEALRIMRLAEHAPEQLTRAEKAAVEGKIAWRESMGSWRSSRRNQVGSTESSSWSWSEHGSGGEPGHLSKGSTSSSSLGLKRDLEMALPPPRPSLTRGSSSSPVSTKGISPVQLRATEKRQNAYDTLVGKQNRTVRDLTGPPGPERQRTPSSVPQTYNPASAFGIHAERPTIVTDSRVLERDPVEDPSKKNTSASPGTKQPTPTMLYGFHLPRPQAGQAYSMVQNPDRQHDFATGEQMPHFNVNALEMEKSTPRIEPHRSPVEPSPPTSVESVQLALISPSRTDGTANKVPRPAIVKHVSAPLMRRSAHIRRSSSSSAIASGGSDKRGSTGRRRSGRSSLSSSSSSRNPQGDLAPVGPSWHRERMKKLHRGVNLDDLPKSS